MATLAKPERSTRIGHNSVTIRYKAGDQGWMRPAIEQPREVHLHLHGVSADDIAAAIRQATGDD
jgi:hypothetical protein